MPTNTVASTNGIPNLVAAIASGEPAWVILLIVAIAATLAAVFLWKIISRAEEIPGKKELLTTLFFLFTVLAALAIIALLAMRDVLDRQTIGNLLFVILTALGVKKMDSLNEKEKKDDKKDADKKNEPTNKSKAP
jgi:DMSO reductase anchor subunit